MSKTTKSTKIRQKAVLKSLGAGSNITDACKAAKIDRTTFYLWLGNSDFKEKVEAAKESRIQVVEDALFHSAIKGNITAQIFYLCNRAKDKWQSLTKVEHTGNLKFDLFQELKKLDEEIKKEKT